MAAGDAPGGGLVLHWREHAPYGAVVEFLLAAGDMGEVRRIASTAQLYCGPPSRKDDALPRKDPLASVARAHVGELLWRLEGETDWQIGADAAAEWRQRDIDRVNATIDSARQRRHRRR